MNNKYFKSYREAWEFVHKFATGGYDHDKQAEACEAFRMMNEAAQLADEAAAKENWELNPLRHLDGE